MTIRKNFVGNLYIITYRGFSVITGNLRSGIYELYRRVEK